MTNWIGAYDEVLTHDQCKFIISEFDKIPHGPGMIAGADGDRVDKETKDSTDALLWFTSDTELSNIIGKNLISCVKKYREEYPCVDIVDPWMLYPAFNIQRYFPGQGFHRPHCETDNKNSPRILAWMIYLNTVTDGGETRFPGYDLNMKAVEGRVLIWPAYFTHVHHGLTSSTQTKYIATGWFVFS